MEKPVAMIRTGSEIKENALSICADMAQEGFGFSRQAGTYLQQVTRLNNDSLYLLINRVPREQIAAVEGVPNIVSGSIPTQSFVTAIVRITGKSAANFDRLCDAGIIERDKIPELQRAARTSGTRALRSA